MELIQTFKENSAPSTDGVPKECFDSRTLPPDERLAAVRQLTASLYDIWPRNDPAEFEVVATAFRVGSLVFNQVRFSPAHFQRGSEQIAHNKEDFLVLEAVLTGSQQLMMSHGKPRMLEGNIYLRDWTYEFESDATQMRLNSIMIPRHLLRAGSTMSRQNPIVSWSMSDPGGRLLTLLWSQLIAEFEQSQSDAKPLTVAFLGFLDGLLGETPGEKRSFNVATMQQYLDARLQGDVGVEQLCEHFYVSRSKVYRLFKQWGGVKRYIAKARLERCYSELFYADPTRGKITDIAFSWGFKSASSFTRSFRGCFGMSPTQVLGQGFRQKPKFDDVNKTNNSEFNTNYLRWLQEAAGSEQKI